MSSRKLQKWSMWREGQRRSPRLSALDACKPQPPTRARSTLRRHRSADADGPASRTRKKRRVKPLEHVVAATCLSPISPRRDGNELGYEGHPINKVLDQTLLHGDSGEDSSKNEDRAISPVAPVAHQQSSLSSTSWIPEKRVLELILDTLQRRDTHEIFAEPVDPEEVDDYYEIIKEPMDFGTMRAKLHEGMYRSLEQFEQDVFLISQNAMHFNSTATIYFRQARAIHELAKKVFHALKTDPGNFEMQLSDTRRRSGRKSNGEARNPIHSSSLKLVGGSTKTLSSTLYGSSNFRRIIWLDPGCSSSATNLNARVHQKVSGARDGRRSCSSEVDRRSTYRSWTCSLNENDLTVSTIYNNSKAPIPVNLQEMGYRESLMLFVQDLGPTARMVADRKLRRLSADASNSQPPNPICAFDPKLQNPASSTFAQLGVTSPVSSSSDVAHAANSAIVFGNDKVPHEKQSSSIHLGSYCSIAGGRDLNSPVAGHENEDKLTDKNILEDQTLLSDPGSSNTNNCSSFPACPWHKQNLGTSSSNRTEICTQNLSSQPLGAKSSRFGFWDSTGASQSSPSQPVQQFIFDLPYLKAQLNQINSLGQDPISAQDSRTEGYQRRISSNSSHYYKDNHQLSSLDAQNTDLALQL